MKNILVLFAVLFVKLASAEKTENRVRRQIYYQDIQSKPKSFRSRPEEKETLGEEQDILSSPFPPINLGSYVDSLSRPPPKVLSPKPILEYESVLFPKPVHQAPIKSKPLYKPVQNTYLGPNIKANSYNIKPKPIHKNAGYQGPKPKPAYEEPHIAKSAVQVLKPSGLYGETHPKGKKKKNPIPGIPGKDYPIYNKVPPTSFTCSKVPFRPGMYANPETGCQAYHVCHDNRHGDQGAAFLCTNGTLFNQETFSCDWWYKVDCSKATSLYRLNTDPEYNPYYQKPFYETQKDKQEALHLQYSEPSVTLAASSNVPKPSFFSREAKPNQQISHPSKPAPTSISKGSGGLVREVAATRRQNQVPRRRIQIGQPAHPVATRKATKNTSKKTSIIGSRPRRVKSQPQVREVEQEKESFTKIHQVQAGTSLSGIQQKPFQVSSFNFQVGSPKKSSPNPIKERTQAPFNVQSKKPVTVHSSNHPQQAKTLADRIKQLKSNSGQLDQANTAASKILPANFETSQTFSSKIQVDQAKLTSDIEPRQNNSPANQGQAKQPTKNLKPTTNSPEGREKESGISSSTVPRRRVLRRRKRPRPSKVNFKKNAEPTPLESAPSQISTRRLNVQATPEKSPKITLQEVPEDAFVDFEWGKRV